MILLIDNGHGRDCPGKCSPDGLYREYAHCRLLARRIVNSLKARGLDARLLTPEDTDIPLAERVRRVNALCAAHGPANVLLVSVHTNAAGSGAQWMQARGWCVYTSPGVTSSDRLADCLHRAMAASLQAGGYHDTFASPAKARAAMRADLTDGDLDYEARFALLTRTRCAACLTENLFHDCRADLQYITSPVGISAITRGHVDGITQYLNSL